MKRQITLAASCALLAAAMTLPMTATVSAHDSRKVADPFYSLAGTWTSEVTHVDCVSGQPTNPPVFKVLESFHLGGTYSQFGAGLGNRRSNGFGTWQRTGKNTFSASFTFFRFDFAAGSIPEQIIRIDRRITMTAPNELTSSNKSTIMALDGTPIATACANEVGTRV